MAAWYRGGGFARVALIVLVLQLATVGQGRIRRETGHVYRSHGHYGFIRHGDPEVIAERELESEGRFGAEQAVILPFSASEPLLFELQADRGRRAESLTEHVLSHPHLDPNNHDSAAGPLSSSSSSPLAANQQAALVPSPSPPVLMEMQMAQSQSMSAAPPPPAFVAASALPPPPSMGFGMEIDEDEDVIPPPSLPLPANIAPQPSAASSDDDLVLLEQDMTIRQSRGSMPPGLPSDMPPGFLTVEQRMTQMPGPVRSFPTPLGMGPPTPAMAMAANFAPRFVAQQQQQQQQQQRQMLHQQSAHSLQEQLRQHHTMQLVHARANTHLSLPPQRNIPQTGFQHQLQQQAPGLPSSPPPAPRFAATSQMMRGSPYGPMGSPVMNPYALQQQQMAPVPSNPYASFANQRLPEDAYYDHGMLNHLVQPQNAATNTLPGPPRLPDLPPPPVGIY